MGDRSDENLTVVRGFLESRSDVDRVSHDCDGPTRQRSDHDFAGVDADGEAKPRVGRHDGQCRRHGPFSVVVVHDGHPEHGHQRIADVFVDCSPVSDDDVTQLPERRVDDPGHVFGIASVGEAGKAHDVGKEHRGELAFLRRGPGEEVEGRAAVSTE